MELTPHQMILAVIMVITGSINTLSTKWADKLSSKGSNGEINKFNHPFVQACFMFIGEIFCLITFKILYRYYTARQVIVEDVNTIRGNQNFNPLLFFPPAMFDMVATSLMYIGLEMTYASSFQMLRGSVIVFVALLSTSFVGRTIKPHHWGGIFFIILGLIVVGWSDASSSSNAGRDNNLVLTGDMLIIMAQIITACQMVYEEKYVVDKDIPPLQAVGWEGTFGFIVLSILLIPFYYIHVPQPFGTSGRGVIEDLPDALTQISNNFWLLVSCIGTMISIAFFNFAGISVTKEISATSRMVLDSVRTFFIWIISIFLHWQSFSFTQLLGFGVLLLGMCVYYNIIPYAPYLQRLRQRAPSEEPIITQRADEP